MNLQEFSALPKENQKEVIDEVSYEVVLNMPVNGLVELGINVLTSIISRMPIEKQYKIIDSPINEVYDLFIQFVDSPNDVTEE
jgi:hypothetical protein